MCVWGGWTPPQCLALRGSDQAASGSPECVRECGHAGKVEVTLPRTRCHVTCHVSHDVLHNVSHHILYDVMLHYVLHLLNEALNN